MARTPREGSKAEEARESVKEEEREGKAERKNHRGIMSPAKHAHGRRMAAARR